MQQHPARCAPLRITGVDRALARRHRHDRRASVFGYAALVRDKPSGYSFLTELEGSRVQQISIEAAQPKLDLKMLRELPTKTIILASSILPIRWSRRRSSSPTDPPRAGLRPGRAPGRGARLRDEISAAGCRVRQDAGDGGRRGDGAARTRRWLRLLSARAVCAFRAKQTVRARGSRTTESGRGEAPPRASAKFSSAGAD